uniref:ARAD1C10054p n=1 Tax=Blastobotrys adeninivorans TaxID=409370 RepID=A0A060T588_BLAAD
MAETAVSYAALILADAEVEITSDKLQTLVKAAGVTEVEPIWTELYAKAVGSQNLTEVLTKFEAGGAAPAAAGGAAAAAGGDAAAAEEKEEEAKEESDEDMGMGLFD